MAYLGVDIGGTFTDIVHLDDDGSVVATKVASTPPRFEEGVFAAVAKAAELRNTTVAELLGGCELVLHGTTVATNALVQHRGARVGMITTAGHRDTLPIMRASGKVKGLSLEQVLHASGQYLPAPVVEQHMIREVNERSDVTGEVLVPLNEEQLKSTLTELLEAGAEAIAICFLWSIASAKHEIRAREIVRSIAPDIFIAVSHEASARVGEYERFAATAINAFLGPETSNYMNRLWAGLEEQGMTGRLLIMQAAGGVTPSERAARLPTHTIGSGPVAGVAASAVLAMTRQESHVIATDMGGTSFDVGLIAENTPVRSQLTTVNQYEFHLPRTDIRSIGSGGGSIIWFDEDAQVLRVGPESAGAYPGPVCYGRGGTRATITDANLVLGYLDEEQFLGGRLELDRASAVKALEEAGAPLGLSAVETALATRRIIISQMADLIRQMTVEQGMDPRGFSLYSYGGAGGLHVAGYLKELGCSRAIIPLGTLSTTWSAYGCATSDVVHIEGHAVSMVAPFDAEGLREIFAQLESKARAELLSNGILEDKIELTRLVEMKYPLQIHHVEVEMPEGHINEALCEALEERFAQRYEQLYGRGAAFTGAKSELVSCQVLGRGRLPQPTARVESLAEAKSGQERTVTWQGEDGPVELVTAVVSPEAVAKGSIAGPAIITSETTTILVPPEASASADQHGNLVITV